jgi:hypothetical protein
VSVKQTPRPEFSRPIARERLAEAPFSESIAASAEERKALAGRLELEALGALRAEFDVLPEPGGGLLRVKGLLEATVTQLCVVTLEPVETTLNESFEVVYSMEQSDGDPAARSLREDLDPEEEPAEIVAAQGIDLGELAAQYLSLALDPFPRKSGISLEDVWSANGEKVASSPFATLERWRAGR